MERGERDVRGDFEFQSGKGHFNSKIQSSKFKNEDRWEEVIAVSEGLYEVIKHEALQLRKLMDREVIAALEAWKVIIEVF